MRGWLVVLFGSPWRVFRTSIMLSALTIAFGAMTARAAYDGGFVVSECLAVPAARTVSDVSSGPLPSNVSSRCAYPFNSILFAIDNFVPGLDLGYQELYDVDLSYLSGRSDSFLAGRRDSFLEIVSVLPDFFGWYIVAGALLSGLTAVSFAAALARNTS